MPAASREGPASKALSSFDRKRPHAKAPGGVGDASAAEAGRVPVGAAPVGATPSSLSESPLGGPEKEEEEEEEGGRSIPDLLAWSARNSQRMADAQASELGAELGGHSV